MIQSKQSKSIHYKRTTFLTNGETLQDLLESAYKKNKKATQRKEPISIEDGIYRIWNTRRNTNGMVFGSVVVYAENKDQPLIMLDDTANEFEINQLSPPTKNGKKQGCGGEIKNPWFFRLQPVTLPFVYPFV